MVQAAEGGTGYSNDLEAIKKLLSTSYWEAVQGTNTSAFNAHPTGAWISGSWMGQGLATYFWTSSVAENNEPIALVIKPNSASYKAMYGTASPTIRHTLRFVKDNN